MLRDGADNSDMNAGVILADTPVLSPVAQATQFVDWAAYAISGANLDSWSNKDAAARSNLTQFWQINATNYNDDPATFDALNLRAYKVWAAVAELAMVGDNPPAQAKYQTEAQQAYSGAIAAAQRVGSSTSALEANASASDDFYKRAIVSGVDDRLSTALKDRVNELANKANDLLGIPLWAWGAGVVGLLLMLKGKR